MQQLVVRGSTFRLLSKTKADLLVTDPPFSSFVQENLRGNLTDQTKILTREAGYEPMTPERRVRLSAHWLTNVPKGWIVWFSDWESVGHWRESIEQAGGLFARAVPWVRWSKPVGRYSVPSGSEAVCFARRHGSKCLFNGRGRTHYIVKCLRGVSKEYEGYNGQKPVELMVQILEDVRQAGTRLVVDDHCGTGSTLLAARQLGLSAVGIDNKERAVTIAKRRLGL